MLIENICLYIGSIIPQERPLAPIRLANAGSCPSRQRDCVATAARSAETQGTAQLVLRTQARRKEQGPPHRPRPTERHDLFLKVHHCAPALNSSSYVRPVRRPGLRLRQPNRGLANACWRI